MAPRSLRPRKRWADAELAVGALERPDPLDVEDVGVSPTALDLPHAKESRFEGVQCSNLDCSRPATAACPACGSPLCEECLPKASGLASPAGKAHAGIGGGRGRVL